MKIRYIILLTGIMLTAVLKSSPQNCAAVDKKDPFTNARIIETSEVKVYGGSLDLNNRGFFLFFQLKNDTAFACIDVSCNFMNANSFQAVTMKLSDHSTLRLDNFFSTGRSKHARFSREKSYSMIDKATLTRLAGFKVTSIRFVTADSHQTANAKGSAPARQYKPRSSTGETLDNDLSSREGLKIMKRASCILAYQH
jgi:hypothetical protein